MSDKPTPEDQDRLRGKMVLEAINDGLGEKDALVLAEWSKEDFEEYKKQYPKFAQKVARAKVKYKQMLLKPVNSAASKGDEKAAMWMLERKYQKEYSNKRRPEEDNSNPIAELMRAIQAGEVGRRTLPQAAIEVARDQFEMRQTRTNGDDHETLRTDDE